METNLLPLPERDQEHERVISIVFDLPPQQAALVSCLARGAVASSEQLKDYLESKTHPKIAVAHVRNRLRKEGMDIKSRWSVGYWMEEDTRAGIEARIREFLDER